MNLEQKKKLAEWMGYEIWNGQTIYKPETKKHENKNIEIENWNPDTNHKQFAEVWNKLTPNQKHDVILKYGIGIDDYETDMILNNLPAVLDAVLEIIEESAKEID